MRHSEEAICDITHVLLTCPTLSGKYTALAEVLKQHDFSLNNLNILTSKSIPVITSVIVFSTQTGFLIELYGSCERLSYIGVYISF